MIFVIFSKKVLIWTNWIPLLKIEALFFLYSWGSIISPICSNVDNLGTETGVLFFICKYKPFLKFQDNFFIFLCSMCSILILGNFTVLHVFNFLFLSSTLSIFSVITLKWYFIIVSFCAIFSNPFATFLTACFCCSHVLLFFLVRLSFLSILSYCSRPYSSWALPAWFSSPTFVF